MTKSRSKKVLDPPALDMGTEQTRKRLRPDPIVSAAQKWRKANMRDAPALRSECEGDQTDLSDGCKWPACQSDRSKRGKDTWRSCKRVVSPTAKGFIYPVVEINGASNGYIC